VGTKAAVVYDELQASSFVSAKANRAKNDGSQLGKSSDCKDVVASEPEKRGFYA
jgi:hypothetical protein